MPPERIEGVHLTLLRPDGSGKVGTDRDKLMIGASAFGFSPYAPQMIWVA